MKLINKVALVTGAQRGIGKAIAMLFAQEGAIIVAADMNMDVEDTVSEINKAGQRALGFVTDITSPEQVNHLVKKAIDTFGHIDILVNNAGVVGKRFFLWESDDAIWRNTIEVNLFGTYNVTKAVMPHMIKNGKGRVINIASISGKQGSVTNSAYCASKHGVIGLTRTLAQELGVLGLNEITVNAICPGVVNTDMLTGEGMILDELVRLTGASRETVLAERILPLSIQKRLIEPEEIADMAVYLASDLAKGITGQAINICAGSVFS
jgi:NAD(P)-dependent dehydrogenase (short-subunit alcohol dehydrogenase family)